MKNKTSLQLSGFWFHITWEDSGEKGIDQNGHKWLNKANPEPAIKSLPEICKMYYNVLNIMSTSKNTP